jgi:YHS domain-containing protein
MRLDVRFAAWIALLLAGRALGADIVGTLPVDPVALAQGTELPGDEALSAEHYRFRYLFASEENRARFLKAPQRYEIQLGGGCGRMGPLSGVGRPELFAAYDGQIYIFASEACRKTFLAQPHRLIESDDPQPSVLPGAVHKGRALLERAIAAMGGAERLDAVRSVRQQRVRQVEQDGKQVEAADALTILFPDRVRLEKRWDDWSWSAVSTGERGWFEQEDERWEMHAQQRRALTRHHLNRNLLTILRARTAPGFLVYDAGEGSVATGAGDTKVERVGVVFDRCAATLGLDPDSGRVVSLTCRSRGPAMFFGERTLVFSDFRAVEGLWLPHAETLYFEGKQTEGEPSVYEVLINPSNAEEAFKAKD